MSPGWRRNLHICGHDDWPDVPGTDDGAEGLAGVVVARRQRPHRISVAGYLLDTYCLGVKDALGPKSMSDSEVPAFRRRSFAAFGSDTSPLEVSLELARHLVWGAADHARRLGFEPHPDFAPVSGHLGDLGRDQRHHLRARRRPFLRLRAARQRPRGHPYAHPHRRQGNLHYLAAVR